MWATTTGATLCALGLLAGSCRREQTSILIVVNSDFAVTSELSEIRVRVTPSAAGAASNELSFTLAPAGDPRCEQRNSGVHCLPLSFAIEPNPTRPAGVPTRVELLGVRAGTPVVQRAAVLSFRTGNSLAYGMFLPRECAIVNNRCTGEGLTCTENGCAPETVPEAQLVSYTQGNERGLARPPGDGGAFADSGMDAMSTPDATPLTDVVAEDAANTDADAATSGPNYTLSVGNSHACALHKRTGQLLCWGANDVGELGRGTVTPIDDGVGGIPMPAAPLVPMGLSAAPVYTSVAAGRGSTCAVTNDNRLFCWGSPNELNLDRDPANITQPRHVVDAPLSNSGSTMRSVSSFSSAYFIRFADGTVTSFGNRYSSATADGLENNGDGPVRFVGSATLPALTNALDLAGSHSSTSIAVNASGAVVGWGDQRHSMLGTLRGTMLDATRNIVGTPMPVPGASMMIAAQAGETAAVALRANGEVYVWGNNEGQLIDEMPDAMTEYATPQLRARLPTNMRAIAISGATAFAITQTGELWCFGARYNNMCPEAGAPGRPRQFMSFGTPAPRIAEVHAGFHFACALTEDDRVFCWGDNQWAQCGAAPSAPILPSAPNMIQLPNM